MNINERLKLLRSSLNLSQEAFGEKIGIRSRAHISALEGGRRALTDRIINDVCREFYVNEEWLRNGIGEMFREEETFSLDDYLTQKNCTEKDTILIKAFINTYMKFPEEFRDSFIDNLINEFKILNKLPDTKVHDVDFIEESKEN